MINRNSIAAVAARLAGSGFLAQHPTGFSLAAASLGAIFPGRGTEMHVALPFLVSLLVGFAVLATEVGPPTQQEITLVLIMQLITSVMSPIAWAGVATILQLPSDFRLATLLLAATPIALSAGALSYSVDLPARPAVWAALLGLLMAPLVLPVVMAIAGSSIPIYPSRLVLRIVGVGILPAISAVAIRQLAPRAVAIGLPRLRDGVVFILLPLMFAAGSSIHMVVVAVPGDSAVAVALSLATLAVCSGIAAVAGRLIIPSSSSLALAIAGGARNGTFAWAAASSVLSPRADVVLSTAAVAALAVPLILRAPKPLALWRSRKQSTQQQAAQ